MRCVHLDFHTSPDISGVGSRFDAAEMTRIVKEASIDLVTVFAKCHHGYAYYPSRIVPMHPGLDFDLLGAEIDAIHAAGAKSPIYITAGWSKLDADLHPEWHQKDFITGDSMYSSPFPEDAKPDTPLPECNWVALCLSGGYADRLEEITREVCESYDPSDGIFYDICFVGTACGCDSCRRGMKKRGMNPDSLEDAKQYYIDTRVGLMKRLTGVVHEYSPNAPVFYNGGADMNRTEYHPYQTHYELEDLPTAWGGYDLMPIRAKFFEKYGKHFLGMTGKFHHAWGEFGGFKSKEALRYECADMLSVGASISVGDHLHPLGMLDESTYRVIGSAFGYAKEIEKYSDDTRAYSDIALWLSHKSSSDIGASKLLQTLHLEYDIVGSADSLSPYRLVIIPDGTVLSDADCYALSRYEKNGGAILCCADSLPRGLGIRITGRSSADNDFISCPLGDFTTPFLSYSSAYITEGGDEVLARVYEPYFNRTVGHFCGHKNTPYKPDAADYPAMVRCGNLLYLAHPVFSVYDSTGNYVIEKYIEKGIDLLYDRAIKTEGLPSTARVRLRHSAAKGFYALHLLYAPPVNRGNVCLLPDFPTLHGVTVELRLPDKVTSAALADGSPVKLTATPNGVILEIPPFSLHSLVILRT